MTTNPIRPTTGRLPNSPHGVWVAVEPVGKTWRLIGVFDTFDLAETACLGLASYEVANIEIGQSYRGRIVDWRAVAKALKS